MANTVLNFIDIPPDLKLVKMNACDIQPAKPRKPMVRDNVTVITEILVVLKKVFFLNGIKGY